MKMALDKIVAGIVLVAGLSVAGLSLATYNRIVKEDTIEKEKSVAYTMIGIGSGLAGVSAGYLLFGNKKKINIHNHKSYSQTSPLRLPQG